MYSMEKKIAIHIYSIVKSLRKTALLCQTSHSTISRWINNPNKKIYTKPNKIYKSNQIIYIIKLSIANDGGKGDEISVPTCLYKEYCNTFLTAPID